jgi:putative ABC transport system permease protein
MDFFIALRIAWRALAKNKMRAGLTLLGVVIGIAAVTTMVSLGQSATALVQGQLEGLGTNVLVILPGETRNGPSQQAVVTLKPADADAIASPACPSVLAASPLIFTTGQVVYGNANCRPREMFGVGHNYLVVRNWMVRGSGQFFTEREVESRAGVCVIGQTVVAKLFQTTNPVGQLVRIKDTTFRVIGVLEPRGANLLGDDQDDVVLMPYTTVQKRLQNTAYGNVNAIMASARSDQLIGDAEGEIRRLLSERHRIAPGDPPDFQVQSVTQIAGTLNIITGTITLMLAAIASISLVVGGVGIMNIMLVSVTERTREIGIRMAMGARSRDILRQFLTEAVLLATFGGVVGILLGIAASAGVMAVINTLTTGAKWPVVVSFPAALIALVFAAAVGIFFGYYPAHRASKLDPIEALRYE